MDRFFCHFFATFDNYASTSVCLIIQTPPGSKRHGDCGRSSPMTTLALMNG